MDPALKAISEKIDFLGVNYYEQHVTLAIAGDNRRDAAFTYPGERRTAAGVGINPHRTATNPNSKTAFLTSNARPGLKAVPCLGPRCRRERCPCIEVMAAHQPENAPAALACSRRDYTIRCGITRPLRGT